MLVFTRNWWNKNRILKRRVLFSCWKLSRWKFLFYLHLQFFLTSSWRSSKKLKTNKYSVMFNFFTVALIRNILLLLLGKKNHIVAAPISLAIFVKKMRGQFLSFLRAENLTSDK